MQRIPEAVLVLLAALGGSVGAVLGMLVFHHKTRKKSFWLRIVAVLVLQAAAIVALYYRWDPPYRSELLNPAGMTLAERIETPKGFVRTEAGEGSLGAFLRGYGMEPDGTKVHLYNGKARRRTAAAAVFSMHLGERNLQQCADSVMRVYAEYLRSVGREDEIAFHFVSGFLCDWKTFRSGMRVAVDGNDVTWFAGAPASDSDEVFEEYLETVFNYASTLSMQKESVPADISDIRIGDIFLRPGSPGHVVLVVDVCEKDGRKAFLLAQGSMPAQQFHVLRNDDHPGDPWYYVDEVKFPFTAVEFTFAEGTFRRPIYLEGSNPEESQGDPAGQ